MPPSPPRRYLEYLSLCLSSSGVRAVKILVIAFNWVVRRPAVAIGSFGLARGEKVGLANVLTFFELRASVLCCQNNACEQKPRDDKRPRDQNHTFSEH